MSVADPGGLTATSSFAVTITNTAPSWTTIPNYSVAFKTSASIPLVNYISDLEGGPYTISGTYLFAGVNYAIPSAIMSWSGVTTLAIAVTSDTLTIGSYTITVIANDS